MQPFIIPEKALAALMELKVTIDNNKLLHLGICSGFELTITKDSNPYYLCDFMSQAGIRFRYWPKFSGDCTFPVPSDKEGMSPSIVFGKTNNYWDINTQYGRDRRELLDWLIEQFKTVIKNKVVETQE